jgi:hypothetical protein
MRIEEIDACSLSPLVALAQDFDSKIEQAAYYLAKEQLTSYLPSISNGPSLAAGPIGSIAAKFLDTY